LRSFVVSVAMRLARNELRKRAIRRFVGLEGLAEHATSPAYDPVIAERFRHLYRALDRLDANGRIAYVLRHVEGYELAEVAGACGCSLSTVKRWLSRVEAKLQDQARRDPVLSKLFNDKTSSSPVSEARPSVGPQASSAVSREEDSRENAPLETDALDDDLDDPKSGPGGAYD
jgi:hypothetical protein